MSNTLNIKGKLDFNDIDLTAPNKVTEELLQELSEQTNGIVLGAIKSYNGPIQSYVKRGLKFSLDFGVEDKEIDIQHDLGAIGAVRHKFECYIYTPTYDHYKFRIFFIQYGLSNYPVKLVLEESVADSIPTSFGDPAEYVHICNTKEEFKTLIESIFTSKRLIEVMQELIRINQATRDLPANEAAETDEKSDS